MLLEKQMLINKAREGGFEINRYRPLIQRLAELMASHTRELCFLRMAVRTELTSSLSNPPFE
jgi:hypothetical protein